MQPASSTCFRFHAEAEMRDLIVKQIEKKKAEIVEKKDER
jgi:hypothetical protein